MSEAQCLVFEETLEERPIITSVASPGEPVVKVFEIVDGTKRDSDSHLERWKHYDGWIAKIRP